MAPPMQPCPVCGTMMRAGLVACKTDWYRLPEEIRDRVNRNFTPKSDPTAAYVQAVNDALAWFAANPAEAPADA